MGASGRLQGFLFEEPNVFQRLALVRISLAGVCILLLSLGPYDRFFADAAPVLWPGHGNVGPLSLHALLQPLRTVAIVAAALAALGVWPRPALIVLTAAFWAAIVLL